MVLCSPACPRRPPSSARGCGGPAQLRPSARSGRAPATTSAGVRHQSPCPFREDPYFYSRQSRRAALLPVLEETAATAWRQSVPWHRGSAGLLRSERDATWLARPATEWKNGVLPEPERHPR